MDWKDIGEDIAKIGLPFLGAALPFPGGAALGSALAHWLGTPSAKPGDILKTLTESADAREKAKQFEIQNQTNILTIKINAELAKDKADTERMGQINTTMQTEASSKSGEPGWRILCGYVVAIGSFVSLCAALGLAYLSVFGSATNPHIAQTLSTLPSLVMMITGTLALPASAVGIATWHGGQTDRIKAAQGSTQNAGN